ncbi:BON domain-containing protein [Luteolibacter arcticus]|uniref:BON domain-containing protein n=1 Tax=Luteolibacter arcticus TaxID=1581411 RepID=A0ABT3GHN6_9BACT|nr:BON domain-containing protein [Luteolibacter arcticus]MCW1922953.1 BON domain-containing protein [Luteolibacter arcticus]
MKNFSFARTTRRLLALTAFTIATAQAVPEVVPQDNAGLAEFIGMTFSADERLAEDSIKISVNQGIATLSGRVATLNQAERAVERTKSVDAVRGVISELKVSSIRSSDEQIAGEITRKLAAAPGIDAKSIIVTVSNKQVMLDGQVGTWDEQEIARELASEVPGVQSIDNRLSSTGKSSRGDKAIRWQIERDIADDPLHDGLNITVSVHGGKVVLAGEVGTQGEKDLLVRQARVTGVSAVSGDGLDITRSLSMEGMSGKTPGKNAIREALHAVFSQDKRLRGADVTIDLEGRVLTLGGTAPSAEVKATAESTARGVPGVEIVINRIAVADDRRVATLGTGR